MMTSARRVLVTTGVGILAILCLVPQTSAVERVAGASVTPEQLCDAFESQAEEGDLSAQLELANCFLMGNGRPLDFEKAAQWLRAAVDAGSPMAANNLASVYLFKMGCTSRYREAVALLRQAESEGVAAAAFNLGLVSMNGLGAPQSTERATSWFEESARRGHQLGYLVMFASHEFGYFGVDQSRNSAQEYWTRFAGTFRGYPRDFVKQYCERIRSDDVLTNYVFDPSQAAAVSRACLDGFDL